MFNLTNTTFDNASSTFYFDYTNPDADHAEWALMYKNHLYINEMKTDGNLKATLQLKLVETKEPFPLYTNSDPKVVAVNPGFID